MKPVSVPTGKFCRSLAKPKGKITQAGRIVFNPNRFSIVDEATHPFSIRRGLYAHYCYEWDEMLIDENDPEFEQCKCGVLNDRT